MEIEKLADEYLEYIKNVKRYSKNTFISYCYDLKEFINYCKSKDKFSLDTITNKFILSYIGKLLEEGPDNKRIDREKFEIKSISRKLSAVRSMFRYAFRNEYIQKNPAAQVKSPKLTKKLPEVASEEAILKILSSIETPLLVKTIFELLYGCGIRVSELCSLRRKDLDLSKNLLRVKGKGNKERIVPVGLKSKEILKEYLTHNKFPINSSLLQKGGKQLYPEFVYRVVRKYLSGVSDIEKKSPHILRHSAATHMLDRGADLNSVKEILGHESLSTTQIYTHVSVDRLKTAYKKAHPKS